MRLGWGADNPSFRQMFTARFIPDATHEQADYFNELQRKTTFRECAATFLFRLSVVTIYDKISSIFSRRCIRRSTLVIATCGRRPNGGFSPHRAPGAHAWPPASVPPLAAHFIASCPVRNHICLVILGEHGSRLWGCGILRRRGISLFLFFFFFF